MENKLQQALQKATIFSALNSQEIEALARIIHVSEFRKGAILFQQEQTPACMHFLIQGEVKAVQYTSKGKEILLRILTTGEVFAMGVAYLQKPYAVTTIALKKSIVGRIQREDLLDVLRGYPEISLKLMGIMSLRIQEMTHRIVEQTGHSPFERIALFLLRETKAQQSELLTLPMSKANLSRMLGTVPETFSRTLTELQHQKIIQLRGKQIQILDTQGLLELTRL
ncbi:MAG: Crp/Fnr family transcriptional regulator [SAR324 cluster bacterium]|nr:Crp/Fnr family transcriptional regulator [SAR324 cluster bacterium]